MEFFSLAYDSPGSLVGEAVIKQVDSHTNAVKGT